MRFSLGISSCPNDTFIFDALVNKKIDTEGIEFGVSLEDIETLNEIALQNKFDFIKISYAMLPAVLKNYILLNSGGALGSSVGPLLISNRDFEIDDIPNSTVAIPGKNTTAHLLFSLAFPEVQNKLFMKFNEIDDFLLLNPRAAGVIIHENRFTYNLKGLKKLLDLGEYWEQQTHLPIPLGCIVANKKLPLTVIKKVDTLIKKSVDFATENYADILPEFVYNNAQELSESVMQQHIQLYVNKYSVNLGEDGKKAVLKLVKIFQEINPKVRIDTTQIFLT